MREELALYGGEKTAKEPSRPGRSSLNGPSPTSSSRCARAGSPSGQGPGHEFEERWAAWAGAAACGRLLQRYRRPAHGAPAARYPARGRSPRSLPHVRFHLPRRPACRRRSRVLRCVRRPDHRSARHRAAGHAADPGADRGPPLWRGLRHGPDPAVSTPSRAFGGGGLRAVHGGEYRGRRRGPWAMPGASAFPRASTSPREGRAA